MQKKYTFQLNKELMDKVRYRAFDQRTTMVAILTKCLKQEMEKPSKIELVWDINNKGK